MYTPPNGGQGSLPFHGGSSWPQAPFVQAQGQMQMMPRAGNPYPANYPSGFGTANRGSNSAAAGTETSPSHLVLPVPMRHLRRADFACHS